MQRIEQEDIDRLPCALQSPSRCGQGCQARSHLIRQHDPACQRRHWTGTTGVRNSGTMYFGSLQFFQNEAVNNRNLHRVAVWALTNTESLDGAHPDLTLHMFPVKTPVYYPPTLKGAEQKPGPAPVGNSMNFTMIERVDVGGGGRGCLGQWEGVAELACRF